jgi:hypothetical protein
MTTLYDHIRELQAELRCCHLTRRERADSEAELAQAITRQAELDRAFDEAVGIQPHCHRAAPDRHLAS